ncbi:MAG: MFS transporter [Chitinophagaceae bacterium]
MQQTTGTYRWVICAMVFFATTINYLDRAVISLLKSTLAPEMNWTETDYANIVVVFQLCYALGLLGAGKVIDALGTKVGYAVATTLWSIAAMAHGAVNSTFGFMIARGGLGVTEAGNFPAAIKAVAEWFPKKERALATGIFNSGTNIGAILAPLTVPFIALKWGWQWAFILTGCIGFIWLLLWWKIYEIPEKHTKLSKEEYNYIQVDTDEQQSNSGAEKKLSWGRLLTFRPTWAFALGKFLTDPIWWFYLFWLPDFLKKEYSLSDTGIAFPVAMAYTLSTLGSIFGGWLPFFFIKRNWTVFRARRTSMLIYAFAALPVVCAQYLGSLHMWLAVLIIGFAMAAHQAWSANIYTTVSDLFPKVTTASVTGIGGMFGALGGMLIARLAGILFDQYKFAGIAEAWVRARASGLSGYCDQILSQSLTDKYNRLVDLNKTDLRSLDQHLLLQLQSIDPASFEQLKALQTSIVSSHLSTSYGYMFLICGSAYLVAWLLMKGLVPKMKPIKQ